MQRSPARLTFGMPRLTSALPPLTSALLFCLLLTGQLLQAQVSFNLPSNPAPVNISAAEYFFDTDPGAGKATALSVTAGNPVTISNPSLSITGLSKGFHNLFIRTRDANGHWSLTNSQALFVVAPVSIPANPALVNVTKAEYFFDTDPGPGKATAIPVTAGTNITASNYVIDITALAPGLHQLYLRSGDANGHWSITNVQALFVVRTVVPPSNPATANVTKAEYFFDTDPGIGKGNALSVTAGTTTTISSAIPLTGLAIGIHRLYLRTADANGRWSLTNESNLAILNTSLVIPPNPAAGNITLLEYFFDTDPGLGNGTTVAIAGTTNLVNYTFTVDVSGLAQGNHIFYVRTFDGWSQTVAVPMHLGTPLPVNLLSFTASLQTNHTVDLHWTTSNEIDNRYFVIQRSGNAADYDSIGVVAGAGTTGVQQQYAFVDASPLPGMNYYRLKQVDYDGHGTWSPVVSVRDQEPETLVISPNPAHDRLNISLGAGAVEKGIFRIVDIRGRLIQSINANSGNIRQIDISALEPGTYMLQYLTPANSTTIPFIKF